MPRDPNQQYTLDGRSLTELKRLLKQNEMRISNLEYKLRKQQAGRFVPRYTFMGQAEEAIGAMVNNEPESGSIKVFYINPDGEFVGRPGLGGPNDTDAFFRVTAYSLVAIAVDDQVMVTRDNFGTYWVVPAASSPEVILELPFDDEENFLLPQDLSGDVYGHPYVLEGIDYPYYDTAEEYVLRDIFGSCALPGQRVVTRYSAELEAYHPWPPLQNHIQRARTYRDIDEGYEGSANGIWLLNSFKEDVVELSESTNNFISYTQATSGLDIIATEDDPREFWVMLHNEGGGVHWSILVPECNPGIAGAS